MIPSEIINQDLQHNGWVYIKIVKDMYGLKEYEKLVC